MSNERDVVREIRESVGPRYEMGAAHRYLPMQEARQCIFRLLEKSMRAAEAPPGTVVVSTYTASSALGTLASLLFYNMEDYEKVAEELAVLGNVDVSRSAYDQGVFAQLSMYETYESDDAAFADIEAALGDTLQVVPQEATMTYDKAPRVSSKQREED